MSGTGRALVGNRNPHGNIYFGIGNMRFCMIQYGVFGSGRTVVENAKLNGNIGFTIRDMKFVCANINCLEVAGRWLKTESFMGILFLAWEI